MANICLTRPQIDALKSKVKDKGGKGLTEMSSADRKAYFVAAIGDVAGTHAAATFEKAMVGKQKNALKNWAKRIFDEKEQKKPSFFKVIKNKILLE